MASFYWHLFKQVPRQLVDAASLWFTLLALVVSLLAVFSRELASAISVSPWLALIPTAVLLIYALARINYERYMEADNLGQKAVVSAQRAEVYKEQCERLERALASEIAQREVLDQLRREHPDMFDPPGSTAPPGSAERY